MSRQDPPEEEMTAHNRHLQHADNYRRNARYHPSVWGDYFLTHASQWKIESEDKIGRQIKEFKNEVEVFFEDAASNDNPLELLSLIDHIQRLGIGYKFEKEIDGAVKQINERSSKYIENFNGDLHTMALMFRLLRQQGHQISCNIFHKFKDINGNFDKSLKTDVKGLLSLHEACHFRCHNEDILDEALIFTHTHLTSLKEKSSHFRNDIAQALKHPIRNGFRRITSWRFIKIYEEETSYNETLLKLAKLEFNRTQKLHQRELAENTEWWKNMNAKENFPFARDRIVENYLWSLLAYEPEHTLSRKICSRTFPLYVIMDDIFDVHGTMEELELFMQSIERWDTEAIVDLPEYLKLYFKELFNLFLEIEQMWPEEERSYRMHYCKLAAKIQARSYFQEAKWFHEDYTPSLEEYIQLGSVSCAVYMAIFKSLLGMPGDVATKDIFDWLSGYPKLVRACGTAYRIQQDLVSHKFEQKRGHLASSVELYMNQHGVTEKEAEDQLRKIADDEWKYINEEVLRLKQSGFPAPILDMILAVMTTLDCTYSDADDMTVSTGTLKDTITSILVEPIPINT